MGQFYEGLIAGFALTFPVNFVAFYSFYLLKKSKSEPIMYKTTAPSGGPAYGKKPTKRIPKAVTELMEWKAEQENEG